MGFLEERDLSSVPSIPEYYSGKTIFITGGSGYMGKVLIEKLLYSCPDLDRIYLLLREKKGVKSEDRLAALYATVCFNRLREQRPGLFESKVFVIPGDIMELGLGISENDRTLIVNNVNIIFHVAASVRFDDPLTFAATLNLRGTKQVIELAKEIQNLSSLVHVSTSYSNANRDPVEEVMYPPHADWRDTLDVVDKVDEHTLSILTPKYLGELPNTYTFTKQLAEHVVYEQKGKLPIAIIRPSIVISSIEEPMPGWIENFNGPAGITVACGKGIMRSIYSDPDLIPDYIPVDISIKCIITAAWMRGVQPLDPEDDIPIYNCCRGKLNNVTMGELVTLGKRLAYDIPLNDMLWNVGGTITTSKFVYNFKVLLMHLLPALLVDVLLWILGKKPLLVKIQRRIYTGNLALRYYITKQWVFNNKNFVALRSCIKTKDKEAFFYDIENIDKLDYLRKSCLGGRRYLMKEKDEDLPKARAHLQRLVYLEKFVKCVFYGYLLYLIVNTSYVQNVFSSLPQSVLTA